MRKIFSTRKKIKIKDILRDMVMMTFSVAIFAFIIVIALDAELNRVVQYDCDMLIGGWHPDVPPKVLEECRKEKPRNIRYDT